MEEFEMSSCSFLTDGEDSVKETTDKMEQQQKALEEDHLKEVNAQLTKSIEGLKAQLKEAITASESIKGMTEQINTLKSQLAESKESEKNLARARDLNTMYVRLQADFDNYKKRTAAQLEKERGEGIVAVLEKMLPIADVIDNALAMIKDESVAEGVAMVKRELEKAMAAFGVTEIKALGKPFDPAYHEAILKVPCGQDSEMSGKVTEVFRKGYAIGDRVLRHSVVKVAE